MDMIIIFMSLPAAAGIGSRKSARRRWWLLDRSPKSNLWLQMVVFICWAEGGVQVMGDQA